jgi:hypothetical protein
LFSRFHPDLMMIDNTANFQKKKAHNSPKKSGPGTGRASATAEW